MRIYGMQAKNKGDEVDAAEIRVREERRLGAMISDQELGAGLSKGPAEKSTSRRKVARGPRPRPRRQNRLSPMLGSAKTCRRAQKIAAVPAEEFEAQVGEWRERVATG